MAALARTLTGVADPSYDVAAPWATIDDLVAPCCPGESADVELLEDVLLGASTILYRLTGRLWFGEAVDIIRPTGDYTAGLESWQSYDGYAGRSDVGYQQWPGMWGACGCNRDRAGCWSTSEIRLPGYPVVSVDEILIDGVVLSAAHYRVQDRSRLVYVPQTGETREGWPCCQNVTLATTQPDTWQVTYSWGVAPPRFWQRMAAVLACEFYKSMTPTKSGECRLPKRIQSITRQGVTIAVLDSFDVFTKGLTGIPEIDMAIMALRTDNSSNGSRVVIPGSRPTYRRDT